jgi:hypothetical protein
MSFIINICVIIVIIIFIYYAYYFITSYFAALKNRKIALLTNPPGEYMQNSGIKCPDYWVNTGIDRDQNYICKNSFNIRTNNRNNNKCNNEIIKFPPIPAGTTWEYGNPNGLTTLTQDAKTTFLNQSVDSDNFLSRCGWIQNCGPGTNVMGTWQGVNEICTNSTSTDIQ